MNDIEIYGELMAIYLSIDNKGDYLTFLGYCTEQLRDGVSVETIWNNWTEGKV